jgi:hypothetical protein
MWWSFLVLFVCGIFAVAFNLWYTSYTVAKAQARWCGTLSVLDDSYRSSPPVTQSQRDLADRIAELRRIYGCGPSTVPEAPRPPLIGTTAPAPRGN